MDTPTHNLRTARRKLTDLKPHPANPRNGDTDQIADSLRTNGQFKPIVVTTDGTILAGNHTYAAALQLGWTDITAVTLDVDPTSDAATRILLADNRTSDLGRYDDGLLLDLLRDVDGPLLGTGYDADDLADLASILEMRSLTPGMNGRYDGTALHADGIASDRGFAGKIDAYSAKGTRSIILDYPIDEYDDVVTALHAARVTAFVTTNSEAVLVALREYNAAHA